MVRNASVSYSGTVLLQFVQHALKRLGGFFVLAHGPKDSAVR
ncbi:MAG: hypothetical protein R3F14_39920 [Polyangiaceae bacterium]